MNKRVSQARALANRDSSGGELQTRSLWQDARLRFFKNRAAVVSVFVLIFVILFAMSGTVFSEYSHEEIDWTVLGKIKELGEPSLINGHYFGVDPLGRDLYARVVQGSGISLSVAAISTLIAVLVGVTLGMIAGYFGGKTDNIIMRIVDIMISVPYILFLIVWLAIVGRSTLNLLLVIGLISWMSSTIIVRGQVRILKHREFIASARLLGLSSFQILRRHILPNILGIVVIDISLSVPNIILMESIVSFLGIGVQEPDTSWGSLISEGAATMQYGTYWQLFFPALFFMATQIALYYIGDGLRDALDPKDR